VVNQCGAPQVSTRSEQGYTRSLCSTATARYPAGIYAGEEEVENKAVFLHDDELEDNAKEIAIDMARLAWETKGDDITVVDVAAQTSICRCESHFFCSTVSVVTSVFWLQCKSLS
jgi:hypothetical protein